MAGLLTNGLQDAVTLVGTERFPIDSGYANGVQPQSGRMNLQQLAAAVSLFQNFASKTTVSGTRYYSSWDANATQPTAADGGAVQSAPLGLATGIQVQVGSVGGTDNWLVELHDSSGVLLATSATAGALVGTAGTWQQFAFSSPYSIVPGRYFLVVQGNGTTAKPAVYNFPAPAAGTTPLITGSATGVFGTGANFTPATTYTANVGPVAMLY